MPKSMHQRGTKPAFLIVDMSLDLDIGFDSQAGRKRVNEDFAGMQLPGPGEGAHGAIAAIADGVSTGGFGAEAAQTSVTSEPFSPCRIMFAAMQSTPKKFVPVEPPTRRNRCSDSTCAAAIEAASGTLIM